MNSISAVTLGVSPTRIASRQFHDLPPIIVPTAKGNRIVANGRCADEELGYFCRLTLLHDTLRPLLNPTKQLLVALQPEIPASQHLNHHDFDLVAGEEPAWTSVRTVAENEGVG